MIGQIGKVDTVAPQRDRWLLSYADLLTLLLAFFVVMYSVSVVNESKLNELARSIESVMMGEFEALNKVPDNLPNVEIHILDDQWLELTLASEFLFSSGDANLKENIQTTLDNVWLILENTNGDVSVQGHTDNQAIATYRYPSNWELSAARAAALVRFFEIQGVESSRFSATGMAALEPVASNNSENGRRLNRRVALKIRLLEGDLENIQKLTFSEIPLDEDTTVESAEQLFIKNGIKETRARETRAKETSARKTEVDETGLNEIDLNEIDPELLIQILNELEQETE
jgi:chemotaxis protein MotB